MTLIAVVVFVGMVTTIARGTHRVARGGPWVARLAPRFKALQESELVGALQPEVWFTVDERQKQAIIRKDQAQGGPPRDTDLDLGTVTLRPPPTAGS